MKKLLSSVTLVAALLAAVHVQAGSLLGEQITTELGINTVNTDPFDPNFISQFNFGSTTVGAGQEVTGAFGANLDFDANTLTASFGSGHADLPFNGFRFSLANPFLVITNVSVLYDSGSPFGGTWSAVLDPAGHGFGIDLNGSTGFTLILQIDTASVPDSGVTALLLGLAVLGLVKFRRQAIRC